MATTNPRHYSWYDKFIMGFQKCMHIIEISHTPARSTRPNPSATIPDHPLSSEAKKLSANLMRVNHSGEVCAQALYLGQSITTTSNQLRETFDNAAQEEADHLAWCEQRLIELHSHKSYLNPLWFIGSLMIGTFAGLAGDRWSLGFLAETEHQVYNHLERHLEKLPPKDEKSRQIILQMRHDEAKHETTATHLGAKQLPFPVKVTMRCMAKVMTGIAYYI